MMLFTDTVTRSRAARTTSTHGGIRLDWTSPGVLELRKVLIHAVSSTETDRRVEVTHTMWAPLNADVTADDRIRWTDPRGKARTYDVVAEPVWHRGPTPLTSHIEVDLRAVDV